MGKKYNFPQDGRQAPLVPRQILIKTVESFKAFKEPLNTYGKYMEDDKVGRNDPCPCGSGLKYKKCCYGKPAKPKFTAKVIKAGRQEEQTHDLMSRFMEAHSGQQFEMTKHDFRVTPRSEGS